MVIDDSPERIRIDTVQVFERELSDLTGISAEMSAATRNAVADLVDALHTSQRDRADEVANQFYGRINQKLALNSSVLDAVYARAAQSGETFNYHAKKALSWAVDSSDVDGYRAALARYCSDPELVRHLEGLFGGLSHEETRAQLIAETKRPSKLRKAHDRSVETDVVDAAAASLVWSVWPHAALRSYFAPPGAPRVTDEDFMSGLRVLDPALFERNRSLTVRRVELPPNLTTAEYERQRQQLTDWLSSEFAALDNHGHLAVMICVDDGRARRGWELAGDLTLFAERFKQEPLDRLYFRAHDIEVETRARIPALDTETPRFDWAFDGFTYRDLFVLHNEHADVERLVLLFQKNERDETLIPCPACRSANVQGNSYPTMGVRSWECRNLLCPDRSIYNRGKRYSFKALVTQEAIETAGNEIPAEAVRRWRRDVLNFVSDADVVEMLVRFYSMVHDTVAVLGDLEDLEDTIGRKVTHALPTTASTTADFWTSPFFARYLAEAARVLPLAEQVPCDGSTPWTIVNAESGSWLAGLDDACFDAAVTSPPYFNAREYSQWTNLYCYLHDMYLINREVFRVLRPGALYGFNVFDYFDNERTITFSAMGKKRIALSALFVDLFRRIGFQFEGNVVWDKGDIEGKRSYNAGNFSPFYQSPFNCWEHVLLFRKPTTTVSPPAHTVPDTNRVARIKPVMKMVRGENRFGHSAPFPEAIPATVLAGLEPGSLVLDPFGGSGTTARAALSLGLRAVAVEQDPDYCALAERLTKEFEAELVRQEGVQTLF